MAAKDREILALIETSAPPEERKRLMGLMSGAVGTPGGRERAAAVYRLLDELADVGPDDPRVEEAARALAECVPAELLPEDVVLDERNSFLAALCADFTPAQAEAFRRALRIVTEGRS